MAYNSTFTAAADAWAQPAAENIASLVKIQNIGPHAISICATTGSAPVGGPETVGQTSLRPGEGVIGTLAELFPGVSSPTRLWLYGAAGVTASIQYL